MADCLANQGVRGYDLRVAECLHHPRDPNHNGSRKDHVMADKALPCPTVLRLLLAYDPDTGKLVWKPRPRWAIKTDNGLARFTGKCEGKEAFTANSHGYRSGGINGVRVGAHRVAWAISHGEWPKQDIDHINGNRADNRLENLRCVSRAENLQNLRLRQRNVSGVHGVTWNKKSRRWDARIRVNGVQTWLGLFDDLEVACAARLEAQKRLGFHENHGRSEAQWT